MLKKRSKKILSVFFINFLLTLLVVLVAELIFGNWIFGPKYSVLNIPRNENRRFDVSKMMGPTTISYTRDKHGLRGDYSGDPKSIDVLVIGGRHVRMCLILFQYILDYLHLLLFDFHMVTNNQLVQHKCENKGLSF